MSINISVPVKVTGHFHIGRLRGIIATACLIVNKSIREKENGQIKIVVTFKEVIFFPLEVHLIICNISLEQFMQITRYNTFFFLLWSREIYFVVFDPCKDTVCFLNILRREFDEVYWFIWSFLAVLEPWEAPQTQVSSCRAHWFITHTHTHIQRSRCICQGLSLQPPNPSCVLSHVCIRWGNISLFKP